MLPLNPPCVWLSLLLLSNLPNSVTAQCTPHNSLSFRSPVTLAPGLNATVISGNLTTPRGITTDASDNVLVIERGLGVTAFSERDPGCDGWLRTVVARNADLTQGIQVFEDALYVSTSGEVLRYVYNATGRTVSGGPVVLVNGIPPDGGAFDVLCVLDISLMLHPTTELTTRPILLYPSENPSIILVSSALDENIDLTARDPSSGRSQIRYFHLPPANTTPPTQDFFSGALVAYGIRNPAGFAFPPSPLSSSSNNLWVVDNGASIDNVTGLTSTFVNDNPADELNLVRNPLSRAPSSPGPLGSVNRFYGFPDCTTLWNPKADPVGNPEFTTLRTGDQFSLRLEEDRDDAWCQKEENNVPPRLSFQVSGVFTFTEQVLTITRRHTLSRWTSSSSPRLNMP